MLKRAIKNLESTISFPVHHQVFKNTLICSSTNCSENCPHIWVSKSLENCPFCSHKKFCYHRSAEHINPKLSDEIHPDETANLSMISYGSNVKLRWKCPMNHTWIASVKSRRKSSCPFCKNKTEKKVYAFLVSWLGKDTEIITQATFHWSKKYRYDFYIRKFNVLIELDGEQHFSQVSNWTSNDEVRKSDVEKMRLALNRGFKVVRLYQPDIWNESYPWQWFLREKLDSVKDVLLIGSGKERWNQHMKELED